MYSRIARLFCLIIAGTTLLCPVRAQNPPNDPLAHTFSIVARDTVTGQVGVAVQSHWFSVGSAVTWARAGVGAVATQSLVNVSFGPRGLDLLEKGYTPQQAIDTLIASDEGSAFRQVAIIDTKGRVATHTGSKCIAEAGHIKGDQYSVQANMMLNDSVWPAMSETFENTEGSLAERMVASLKAAQAEGGDIRGQQSAAILIVNGTSTGKPWQDKVLELRVEDHPKAVDEITRLLKVHQAYEHMNAGDQAIEKNQVQEALEEYNAAMEMNPDNVEMKFWTAISLANVGKVEQSLPLFKEVFREDRNWMELTRRLTPNNILQVDNQTLERILAQGE